MHKHLALFIRGIYRQKFHTQKPFLNISLVAIGYRPTYE